MTNDLHLQAEQLRESEKFEAALSLYDQAITEYTNDNNQAGIAEALLGKFLTYKHLFLNSNTQSYLDNGIQSIQQSLEIIKKHNLLNAFRAYFSLGEAEMLLHNYTKAVEAYQKALELINNDSPEKGNYQYHLGEALYLSGNTPEGEKELFNGLEEIQRHKNSTDSFLYNVWLSGVNLKIASLFWKNKQKVAKEHLLQAEVIINNDTRLVIRKKQLEKLRKDLN